MILITILFYTRAKVLEQFFATMLHFSDWQIRGKSGKTLRSNIWKSVANISSYWIKSGVQVEVARKCNLFHLRDRQYVIFHTISVACNGLYLYILPVIYLFFFYITGQPSPIHTADSPPFTHQESSISCSRTL